MNNDKQLILSELEQVLASPGFRSRKRIKQFMRYVVHETVAGRGKQLNQYSIAVNALGKSDDFSPTLNPLVRIEAGRLRKLLDDYYADLGKYNPVRLYMPKGSYEIHLQQQPPASATHTPWLMADTVMPRSTSGPRLFLNVCIEGDTNTHINHLFYKLRGDLLLILSRFKNIRLVSSTSPQPGKPLTRPCLQHIWHEYRADFVLQCNINHTAEDFHLSYILAHTPSDEMIWKGLFQLSTTPAQTELDHMYRQVMANTIATHSGAALYHWAEYLQSTENIPEHKQVFVYYLNFLRDTSFTSFIKALNTCAKRLEQYPQDTQALIIFSRLCGYDHVLQFKQINELGERWTQAARMAMKLAPGNAEAHSAFAHNCYFRGEYELSLVEQEIATRANPFDTSTQYLYGLGLCVLEDWENGMHVIRTVMAIPFQYPDWYYTIPFVYAFNQGHYHEALRLAEHIQSFGYWGDLARCVSYFRLGEQQHALETFQYLRKRVPSLLLAHDYHGISALASLSFLKQLFITLQEMARLMPNH